MPVEKAKTTNLNKENSNEVKNKKDNLVSVWYGGNNQKVLSEKYLPIILFFNIFIFIFKELDTQRNNIWTNLDDIKVCT